MINPYQFMGYFPFPLRILFIANSIQTQIAKMITSLRIIGNLQPSTVPSPLQSGRYGRKDLL